MKFLCSYTLLPLLLLCACKQKQHRQPTRAFYYWKQNFNPGDFGKKKTDSLHLQALYVKLFDVVWDDPENTAKPTAKISITDTAFLQTKQIIPTVFITNEILFKTDSLQVPGLAEKINKLVQSYAAQFHIPYTEWQMDCDWTQDTRGKYFTLLRTLKKLQPATTLSATIRLHQVKYRTASGVPPADRGLLMCYNMGDLQDPAAGNSIIDPVEFAKYTGRLKSYPLPLDVGLPLFAWWVWFRNGKFQGLINTLPDSIIASSTTRQQHIYPVTQDIMTGNRLIKKGDMLRYEESSVQSIENIIDILHQQMNNTTFRVAFYHLDSLILTKHPAHEIENMYNRFR